MIPDSFCESSSKYRYLYKVFARRNSDNIQIHIFYLEKLEEVCHVMFTDPTNFSLNCKRYQEQHTLRFSLRLILKH
jgi:hypothetical protein